MPEDVFTSSACPWLKFLQRPILQKFLPKGWRDVFFLIVLAVALSHTHKSFAQYAAFNSVAVNSFQSDLTWATGISTYDINHDGWDDITAASTQHGVAIYLNNQGDFEYINALENIEGNLKTVYWADYDNDADADLLIIRYTANPILLRNDGDWTFTDVTAALPIAVYSPLMQSACWADYDNDGWIDLYINNYYLQNDITNWLFHNNGDGTFTEVAAIVGVDNGSKPTYQSNWIDFDRDGDQDLYVSNDRDAGNQLYINQGNGYFASDTSIVANLYMDAMGVQWHDHDYDGDFDCYISNEIEASVLIENHQGVFVNATESLQVGCPNHVSWGVQWTDPDNDGLDDLCVVHKDFNNITCHYQRNADLSYSLNASSVLSQDPLPSYCLVTGDFNNDGREDLVQNTVSPQRIHIWLANPSDNNSITIGLAGVESNHDGIGALIEVHAGTKHLLKQVTIGESYYGQSSQHEIFGIGAASIIDSIIVDWPSGWTDILYNVNPNQYLEITEGSTYLDIPDTLHINRCFNATVMLTSGVETGVIWDNGDTLSTRMIDTAGVYSCTAPAPFNHSHLIIFNVTDYSPTIEYLITAIDCANAATGTINIQGLEGLTAVSWQDIPDTTLVRTALAAGLYNAQLSFSNNCSTTLSISLANPAPIQTFVWSDTICAGATAAATYSSQGGTGYHTWNWFEEDPGALAAGIHHYLLTDEAGCSHSDSLLVPYIPKPELNWSAPYVCENQTASFSLSSAETILIEWMSDFEPYELPAGEYAFSYSSNEACWFDTTYVVFAHPEITLNIVPTDSICESGQAVFFAEANGGTPPLNYAWNSGDDDAFAQHSGSPLLSCLVTDANGCSAQNELWINRAFEAQQTGVFVYPNPAENQLHIICEANREWKIIDAAGKTLIHGITNGCQETIDLAELTSGAYILQMETESLLIVKR